MLYELADSRISSSSAKLKRLQGNSMGAILYYALQIDYFSFDALNRWIRHFSDIFEMFVCKSIICSRFFFWKNARHERLSDGDDESHMIMVRMQHSTINR